MARAVTLTSRGELKGRIRPPTSKSYTHRAILAASLSEGKSRVFQPLDSDDTTATANACRQFGSIIDRNNGATEVHGAVPKAPGDVVNVKNSGTTLRLMTSVFALSPAGFAILTGDSSIRRRPMQPLIDCLAQLGVESWSSTGNGSAPIVVKGGGFRGGLAELRGDISSQFVSSILFSAPLAEDDTELVVSNPVSKPYIDSTLHVLSAFGVSAHNHEYTKYSVSGGQKFRRADFVVPTDFSSAAFPAAAVALVGGKVDLEVTGTGLPQGDSRILSILSSLGARVSSNSRVVTVESGGGTLHAGSFDLADTPDLLPVLAILALRCDGPVNISGVAHARHKETDRIAVLTRELRKAGASVRERNDGMEITKPQHFKKALMDSMGDHRMFMAFSLLSLLIPGGVPVVGEESASVSYPTFLDDMAKLGAKVSRE